MAELHFQLEEEHLAMLDVIRAKGGLSRPKAARALLIAVLEDDAAAHQGVTSDPNSNVIVFRKAHLTR